MPWTWQEIESEWLGGTVRLADEPDVVVAAFEMVESHFGREWMEADRTTGGVRSTGLAPTLGIVSTGKLLASLDGVVRAEGLVTGLREHSEKAMSEALAIHLLRAQAGAEIEYEPPVDVRGRSRKPDLRARWGNDQWVYGEVAKPDDSKLKKASAAVMQDLVAQVRELSGSFAVEVFLRRRPGTTEVELIKDLLSQLSQVSCTSEVDLPDGLGKVFLNFTEPGIVILDDYGEGYRPGVAMAGTVLDGAEQRHVVVRINVTCRICDTFEVPANRFVMDSDGAGHASQGPPELAKPGYDLGALGAGQVAAEQIRREHEGDPSLVVLEPAHLSRVVRHGDLLGSKLGPGLYAVVTFDHLSGVGVDNNGDEHSVNSDVGLQRRELLCAERWEELVTVGIGTVHR